MYYTTTSHPHCSGLVSQEIQNTILKIKMECVPPTSCCIKLNYTLNQMTRNPNLVLACCTWVWGGEGVILKKLPQFLLTPSEFCYWKCVWLLSSGLWKLESCSNVTTQPSSNVTTQPSTYIQCVVLPFSNSMNYYLTWQEMIDYVARAWIHFPRTI